MGKCTFILHHFISFCNNRCSVAVISDSLWSHGLQHARLPCPSLSPRVCSNPCPLSWWCYPTISSSVAASSSCPQSLPASGSFSVRQFLYQVVKVLELQLQHQSSNQYSWLISFRIDWYELLGVQGLSRVLSNNTIQKHQFFSAQPSLGFPCGSACKESACNVGDLDSIPGLRRSPAEGKGYLLQYSSLKNSMDCIVHGVAKSLIQLSDFHLQPSLISCSHICTWLLE